MLWSTCAWSLSGLVLFKCQRVWARGSTYVHLRCYEASHVGFRPRARTWHVGRNKKVHVLVLVLVLFLVRALGRAPPGKPERFSIPGRMSCCRISVCCYAQATCGPPLMSTFCPPNQPQFVCVEESQPSFVLDPTSLVEFLSLRPDNSWSAALVPISTWRLLFLVLDLFLSAVPLYCRALARPFMSLDDDAAVHPPGLLIMPFLTLEKKSF